MLHADVVELDSLLEVASRTQSFVADDVAESKWAAVLVAGVDAAVIAPVELDDDLGSHKVHRCYPAVPWHRVFGVCAAWMRSV